MFDSEEKIEKNIKDITDGILKPIWKPKPAASALDS
jgi:hypothetical protein